MFPPEHDAGGACPGLALLRPRRAGAARGLVEGALAPADPGPAEGRRRPARDLRRRDARADRRAHDAAHAERPGLVQGRPLPRRPVPERARPLVHVVVRRLGGPEPRALQLRAADGQAGHRRPAVGRHRAGRALQLHPRDREHDCRRAEHGRRPLELPGGGLRLLRPLPQERAQPGPREAAEGDLLHHGHQQVADVGHLAARRGQAADVLPVERRQGQHDGRRRRAGVEAARRPTRPTRSPTTR